MYASDETIVSKFRFVFIVLYSCNGSGNFIAQYT